MPPRTIAIIQARMASSRLPGKVLLEIAGTPMLGRVVERARQAQSLDEVLVATTTNHDDDPVADYCQQRGYRFTRGSLHDVLDRYYQAACQSLAELVVRITADCPLLDPQLLDETVQACQGKLAGMDSQFDFAANRLPPPWGRSYPIGLDVEVCSFSALETAWQQADQPFQREHVMPYLYEGVQFRGAPLTYQAEGDNQRTWIAGSSFRGFNIVQIHHSPDFGTQRWTVDTPEDLALLRQIVPRLEDDRHFSWLDVLALLQREPQLARINAQIQHKDYRAIDERRHD